MNEKLFTKRLKEALHDSNMNQAQLCDRTKIPKSAMSQYIHGKSYPKSDRVYTIALALFVNPAWLMGFDVPREPVRDMWIRQTHNDENLKPDERPIPLKEMPFDEFKTINRMLYKRRDEDKNKYLESIEDAIDELSYYDLERIAAFVNYKMLCRKRGNTSSTTQENISPEK